MTDATNAEWASLLTAVCVSDRLADANRLHFAALTRLCPVELLRALDGRVSYDASRDYIEAKRLYENRVDREYFFADRALAKTINYESGGEGIAVDDVDVYRLFGQRVTETYRLAKAEGGEYMYETSLVGALVGGGDLLALITAGRLRELRDSGRPSTPRRFERSSGSTTPVDQPTSSATPPAPVKRRLTRPLRRLRPLESDDGRLADGESD